MTDGRIMRAGIAIYSYNTSKTVWIHFGGVLEGDFSKIWGEQTTLVTFNLPLEVTQSF